MMDGLNGCNFCIINTAGEHQWHCPLHARHFKKETDVAFDGITIDLERPDTKLIKRYSELLIAYMMTMDLLDVAGEMFGKKRLDNVASFILDKLDECIGEIVNIEEKKNGTAEE